MCLKEFLVHYLSLEETERFAKWAVGDKFEEYFVNQWPDIWNEKHGYLFKIDKTHSLQEDLSKMIEIWKNYGQMAS